VPVVIRHPDLEILARPGRAPGRWHAAVGRGEAELAPARRGRGWLVTWGPDRRHRRRLPSWPAAWAFVAKHAHELSDGRTVDDADA
jgi:hypothetical protein